MRRSRCSDPVLLTSSLTTLICWIHFLVQVILKCGPYGYYVQLGEDKKGHLPKRANAAHVCWSFSVHMCASDVLVNIMIAFSYWEISFNLVFQIKDVSSITLEGALELLRYPLTLVIRILSLTVIAFLSGMFYVLTFGSADDLVCWFLTREPILKMGSLWPWSLVNLDSLFDIAAQWLQFQRYSYLLSSDAFDIS